MLIPYATLLYTSLGHVDDMRFIPGLSLDNFVRVFTVDPYLSVIIKSARIGLMTAVFSSIVAYPLAFYLAFHVRTQRLKFLIFILFSRDRSMVGQLSRQGIRLENDPRVRAAYSMSGCRISA